MENRQKGIFLTSFVLVMSSVNMLLYIYYKRGEVFTMSEKIILVLTAVASFLGFFSVVITQFLYYRKDSKTMDEIKNSLSLGHERLNDRMERGKESSTKEHGEIRDIVRDISLRQDQELELQKKIRDTVPDAGVLKDGIEKICRDNATLRTEVTGLKKEIAQLREKNQKLVKSIRRERSFEDMEL